MCLKKNPMLLLASEPSNASSHAFASKSTEKALGTLCATSNSNAVQTQACPANFSLVGRQVVSIIGGSATTDSTASQSNVLARWELHLRIHAAHLLRDLADATLFRVARVGLALDTSRAGETD